MAAPARRANPERRGLTSALGLLALAACSSIAPCKTSPQLSVGPPSGLQHDTRFSEYAPSAASSELVRRMLSPLAGETIRRNLASRSGVLNERAVDLSKESFVLYVPRESPPSGYGVLVFVPPWPDARLPPGWAPVLDRFGMIFVSAAHSGNDASVLGRRAPLALLAASNVAMRYRVDPEHVFVGGFSGGSRVALRLALDYPDVFLGAFLNAGSDAIGGPSTPLPAGDLFQRFQETSRLYLATGAEDAASVLLDTATTSSLQRLCVSNVKDVTIPRTGHGVAAHDVLTAGLDYLTGPPSAAGEAAGACRKRLEQQVATAIQATALALAGVDRGAARKAVLALDRRFAGLAGGEVISLADRCKCNLFNAATIPSDKISR